MTNNNTINLVESVINAGPGLLKKDVCEHPLVKLTVFSGCCFQDY